MANQHHKISGLESSIAGATPLYLITDSTLAGLPHAEIVRRAVSAGIKIVQLRDKQMTKKALYNEALSVRKLTLKHRATFIMNDYIDIALSVNADGVHLGQEDMPLEEARRIMGKKKIIGISTHNVKQAITAEKAGADYIGFGPLFKTATKDAGTPRGLRRLREVRKRVRIPIVAIGGITPVNVLSALEAGADAAAVVSAIIIGNIRENVKNFLSAINASAVPYKRSSYVKL
jgi:thiamine-phosphate diphosphorylase